MIKKIATAAMIAGAVLVSACNTIAGAGEDVESVGETVTDAAE
ncbi:MAG: entericidin A/B family lipoprotein [Parasphingopyxis sp.]|nr:entericidin A/B family lipoprotein [uncultured Parasphingopyxis sp.]